MDKVYIRRLEKKDYDSIYDLIENASDRSFFLFDASNFSKDVYFHLINQMEITKHYIQYGIFHEAILVGVVSLHNIDPDVRSGEYSIYLRPDHHKKGFASYATSFILNEAFKILGLNHVHLRVDPNNETAIRFYERFGFVPCDLGKHKREQGFLCYEITKDDFY